MVFQELCYCRTWGSPACGFQSSLSWELPGFGTSVWGSALGAFWWLHFLTYFCLFFLSFFWYFDYDMHLFVKEKDKLPRRMFCNQRYFHKKASICCFLHTALEKDKSFFLPLRCAFLLWLKQLTVRVSASGKFSSTHLFSLPPVCFLQTEMANLHKASPY